MITEDKCRNVAGPCVRLSLREQVGLTTTSVGDFWGESTIRRGQVGEVVRLHANNIHSLVVADAGIHPVSCSCPYPVLGPYTCRSLAHGCFWKQWQERGFSTAFLEHSEEHSMVFPFLTGQGYI